MHKVRIVYYEGFANRDLKMKMARSRGENFFRPYSIYSEAEYPIVPRPGDYVVFPLDEKDAQYFKGDVREDGRSYHSAIVQWVELNPGIEDLYVVCTDEGHKGRGVYDGDYEADIKKMLDDFDRLNV